MDGPVRDIQPVAVTLGVDTLEPDGEPGLIRVARSVLGDIAAVGNGDVPVHFDFDGIEVAHVVLLVFDAFEEGLAIVDAERLAAGGPGVPVREGEVGGADAPDVSDVATHYGCFHCSLEGEHFRGVRGGGDGGADFGRGDRGFALAECREGEYGGNQEAHKELAGHGRNSITVQREPGRAEVAGVTSVSR